MDLKSIHQHLKGKFADAIGEWAEPEAGDGWVEVAPASFAEVAKAVKEDPKLSCGYLRSLSGVDYPEAGHIQAVYHLFSYEHDHQAILKVKLDRAKPVIASVVDLWPAAEWHEREAYDMLGIEFDGHDNLRRILLPEDWEGFPLRKDYKQPEEYHGISNW